MYKNQQPTPGRPIPAPGLYDLATVLRITMDSFTSATERHIEVGDGLEMFIVRTPPQAAAATASSATGGDSSSTAMDVSTSTQGSEGNVQATSTLDLKALFGAVEATGGEEEQTMGATMVVRKELKKD